MSIILIGSASTEHFLFFKTFSSAFFFFKARDCQELPLPQNKGLDLLNLWEMKGKGREHSGKGKRKTRAPHAGANARWWSA